MTQVFGKVKLCAHQEDKVRQELFGKLLLAFQIDVMSRPAVVFPRLHLRERRKEEEV